MKRRETDMTEGSIVGHLIKFSLPLMLGFIFQQLYNTVDSVTVGRYVSMQALAAVGSTGNIINMLIGFFMGFSTGAGVIISQYFGAHEDRLVQEAVHTAMALALIFGVLFTFVGQVYAPVMLRLMRTPEDVFPEAVTYLRIYFAGSVGLLVYNVGSGILRAVGDSDRPLYFLIVSAVVNIVLDLLFVIVFRMGIAGVGYATIIAELASAICVVVTLMRTDASFRLELKRLKLYPFMLKRIVQIGLPTSIQSLLVSFSNVFVHSYINAFQTDCIAGWSSYSKIDAFSSTPIQAISMSATTFVGQNIGAHDLDRAKKGTHVALAICAAATMALLIPLELFAPSLIGLFGATGAALDYGVMFLRMISPLNVILIASSVYSGALRGVGDTTVPTLIQSVSFIAIRQTYLAIVSRLFNSPLAVGLGYPLGWLFASAGLIAYYYLSGWEKRAVKLTGH